MDRTTNRISKSCLLNLKYHITWIIFTAIDQLSSTWYLRIIQNFERIFFSLTTIASESKFSIFCYRSIDAIGKKKVGDYASRVCDHQRKCDNCALSQGGFMGAARGQWRLHAWWRPIRISLRIQNYSNFNHSPAGQRFINIAVGTGRPFIWNAPQSD